MRRAYTLVEVLIVVVILGIAGALVVPSFASTDSLRVQGALRMLVADITVQQSDAIAYQSGRGIFFRQDGQDASYVLADVVNSELDVTSPIAETRHLGGEQFGWCHFDSIDFPDHMIVFDELGGPVAAPGSDVAAPAGSITISGSHQRFKINLEAYTGRVTVQALAEPAPAPAP